MCQCFIQLIHEIKCGKYNSIERQHKKRQRFYSLPIHFLLGSCCCNVSALLYIVLPELPQEPMLDATRLNMTQEKFKNLCYHQRQTPLHHPMNICCALWLLSPIPKAYIMNSFSRIEILHSCIFSSPQKKTS